MSRSGPTTRTGPPTLTDATPRRISRRIRLSHPLNADFHAGDARGLGLVLNVSQGGCFVRSPLLPRYGTPVKAHLETPSGRRIPVEGVVQWNTAVVSDKVQSAGFGIRLTRVNAEYIGFVDGALSASDPVNELHVRP